MKLDIGCGRNKKADFLGVDCAVEVRPDIVADMWSVPFDDDSVDEIFSTHALEHAYKGQVVPTLKEWERLLRPGGTIDLEVPDLIWCCLNWLRHRTNDWHMDAIFGNQDHVPGELHKTGFTPEIMHGYVAQTRLVVEREEVIRSHGQPTLRFLLRRRHAEG